MCLLIFTNSSGTGLSYTWDFGDSNSGSNNISTATNPSHTFSSAIGSATSTFSATLTTQNASKCSSKLSQTITVKQIPDASIADYTSATPFTNCGSASFNLLINNISTTKTYNTNYRIDWGDASTPYSSSNFPAGGINHLYTSQGYFALNLSVTGQNGCASSKNYSIYNGSNPAVPFPNPGSSIGKCIPFLFSIPSSASNNPSGTIYIVTKNDGTGNDTLQNPPPANYTHEFTTSSCGATGGITSNTFYVNVRAQNPCGFSDLTIQPITTSKKPYAAFSISPDTIVCVNKTATFTNTSILGVTVDNFGVCNSTTKINWTISPSTGWSVLSGSLGDPNPTNDPNTWGSKVVNASFSNAGLYSISIIVRNTCGNDTITRIVCVEPPPTPSFTVDKPVGCSSLQVTATNTTNSINSCVPATYQWSVSYTAAFCGTTPSWSFTNGTDASSVNPSFTFDNPGTYSIKLSVTNSCGPFSSSQNVTVKKPPAITLTPIANSCGPVTITPGAVVTACGTGSQTYAWTFEGGNPATSSNANPGNVSFNTVGPHKISLTVTNECGSTTVSQQLTISNVTSADAGPAQDKCGTSVTMAANTPLIGTGVWTRVSGPNTPVITNPSSPSTTITGMVPGTYIFKWTITNGSCTSSSNDTIIIEAGATQAAAGADQSLCLSTSASLAANTPTIGTGIWSFVSGPNTPAITNPSLPSTTVTGLKPGNYIFRWTISFSTCTPSTDDVQITIYDNPSISNAGSDQTICSSSATMAGNLPTIGTGTWSIVSGPNSPAITIPSSPSTTITGLISGTYLFKWKIDNDACPPSEDIVQIIVTAAPTTPDAGTDQTICSATTITLSGNPATIGTGVWSFVSGPNTPAIITTSAPSTTVTGLIPGVYIFRWTISNGICISNSDDVQVTINDAVTSSDAGPSQNKCGTNVTMAANTPLIGTGAWTRVSGPNTPVITNPSSHSTTITGMVPGTYIFKWTITNGSCTSSSNDTIIIAAATTQATAGSDQSLCLSTSASLAANTPTIGTGTWSFVSGPNTPAITTLSSPSATVTGLKPGNYIFRWTISFSTCTPSTDDVQITIYDNPSISNAGPDQTICSSSVTMAGNSPIMGGTGAWSIVSGPNSPAITTPSSPSTTVTGMIPGTYIFKWKISNGTCTSSEDIVQIIVTPAPTTPDAGPDQTVCSATSITLSGNLATVGTGVWSFVSGPNTPTISNPSLPSTTATGLIPGVYIFRWTISNGICTSNSDDVQVNVLNDLQNQITNSISTICSGQTVLITGILPTGGTGNYNYQWQQSYDNITWTDIPSAIDQNYTAILTSSIYFKRKVTSLPCESFSNNIFINVQPAVTNNTISGDQSICINTAAALIVGSIPIAGDGNYGYQWQQSTDAGLTWTDITGAISKDYSPGTLTITTLYRRTVTTVLCKGPQSNASTPITITVNQNAKAIFNYTTDVNCTPFIIDKSVISGVDYNDRNGIYQWYADNKLIGEGIIFPGYTIIKNNDSVDIKLKVFSKHGCLADSMKHTFYTVEKPATFFNISDSVGCGSLTISFINTTPSGGKFKFLWNFGNGITSSSVNPGNVIFRPSPFYKDTIYKITLKAYTYCDTVIYIRNILVKSKPKSLYTPDKSKGCSPFNVKFMNTSKGDRTTFIWDFGDGHSLTTDSDSSVNHTFNTGVQDTFYIRLRAINECGEDTLKYAIVVSPNKIKLDFAINGNESTGCNPHTVRFINNTNGATSFRWDFGDGNVLTTYKNIDTVIHTYNEAGNYNVQLDASNGCSDTTTTEKIQVFAKPLVSFSSVPLQICIGDTMLFNNLSDTVTSVLWNFNDGYTSSILNPSHRFTNAGVYHVTLTSIRQYGLGNACSDSSVQQVTVVSKLPGVFKVSDSMSVCLPFTVTFTNLSTLSVKTVWDFADGGKDTGDVVVHTFTATGTYKVMMTSFDQGGCTYEKVQTITVRGPQGIWKYDYGYICNNTPVRFEATVTNTDSLRWHFGDGKTLVTKNNIVYHVYEEAGQFLPFVELLAGNNAMCSVVLQGYDSIKVDKLNAGFALNDDKQCGYTNVIFTDTSRIYFGIKSRSWKLGDGTTSFYQNPQHQYTSTNIWPIELVVQSNSGCSDTAQQSIQVKVNSKPIAAIIADSIGCTNLDIPYSANIQSQDSVTLYTWNFDNGLILKGSSVINIYSSSSIYKTTLVVGTAEGCYDTTFNNITIHQSPNVKANDNLTICKGQTAQLNVTGALTYKWAPLNNYLSCNNCPNPLASPSTSTLFIVTGINNVGCSAGDSVFITVAQPIKINITGQDSICMGESTRLFVSGASNYTWSPSIGIDDIHSPSPLFKPSITTFYQVIGNDNYQCFGDTAYVTLGVGNYPKINLGDDKILATGALLPLSNAVTEGPIIKWKWEPSQDLNCTTCLSPIATIKKDICYNVTATNAYGCSGADTICIKVFCESGQVFIPNAFTPDHDGRNDILMVRSKGIKVVKSFRIFNRWGQVVFDRSNFMPNDLKYGWDGTVNGVTAPPDIYVYTCEVVCENDIPYTYKGNVAILK